MFYFPLCSIKPNFLTGRYKPSYHASCGGWRMDITTRGQHHLEQCTPCISRSLWISWGGVPDIFVLCRCLFFSTVIQLKWNHCITCTFIPTLLQSKKIICRGYYMRTDCADGGKTTVHLLIIAKCKHIRKKWIHEGNFKNNGETLAYNSSVCSSFQVKRFN